MLGLKERYVHQDTVAKLVEPSGFFVQTTDTGLGEVRRDAWGRLILFIFVSTLKLLDRAAKLIGLLDLFLALNISYIHVAAGQHMAKISPA